MNDGANKVIVERMSPRIRQAWTPMTGRKKKRMTKRLLRNTAIFAAVCLCMGAGAFLSLRNPERTKAVMSHVTAGFEYDETIGRLQFVSRILPESAMVFLSGETQDAALCAPADAQVTHAWTMEEPWMEYACVGDVLACRDGEIMTIVKNRQDEYTVRMRHEDGYESLYSGLSAVHFKPSDMVSVGQQIGTAAGSAAFELRKDGLSILPVFASGSGA